MSTASELLLSKYRLHHDQELDAHVAGRNRSRPPVDCAPTPLLKGLQLYVVTRDGIYYRRSITITITITLKF